MNLISILETEQSHPTFFNFDKQHPVIFKEKS